MKEISTSKLVDGYKRAFIDSTVKAEQSYTPQFVSNANGNKVLTEIENELRVCSSMLMSVAFITKGGITPLQGVLKEMEARNVPGKILTADVCVLVKAMPSYACVIRFTIVWIIEVTIAYNPCFDFIRKNDHVFQDLI